MLSKEFAKLTIDNLSPLLLHLRPLMQYLHAIARSLIFTRAAACVCLVLIAVLASGCSRLAEDEVARVNGEGISLQDFRVSYNLFPHFDRSATPEAALRQQLDFIINQRLGAAEARRRRLHEMPEFRLQRKMMEKEEVRDELYRQIIQEPVSVADEEVLEAYRLKQYRLKLSYLRSESKVIIEEMRQRWLAGESVEALADRYYGKGKWQKEDIFLPEITWGEVSEEIEQVIFNLRVGEISQPLMRAGYYVIFRLDDYLQNIFVTEEDFIKQRPALEKRIRRRKAAKAARRFVADFMGKKNVVVKAPSFNFLWKYARKQAGLALSKDDLPKPEPLQKALAGELEAHLQDTLLIADNSTWTIASFLERMKTTPPALRPNMLHPLRFKEELQQFILNEFLTELAYKKGMKQAPRVQKALADWQRAVLFDGLQQMELGAIRPSEDELKQYFETQRENYRIPEKRKIREIFTRSEEKIKKARDRLQSGEAFASVAAAFSERRVGANARGELGFLSLAELGDIGKAVFALKKGEIAGPLQVPFGFVMVQLLEIQPGRQARWDEVSGRVEKDYRNSQHLHNWRRLLANLSAAADIKVNEKLLQQEAVQFDPRKSIDLYGFRKAYPRRAP